MKWISLLALVLVMGFSTQAQEHHHEDAHNSGHSEAFMRHHVALGYLNTFIPKADVADGKYVVYAPSFFLEYEYRFHHKWSVLAMGDVEFAKYSVLGHDGLELERENVAILDAAMAFKLAHNIQIFTGPGVAFEKHENLFMWRFGFKNEFPFAKRWDVVLDVEVDVNEHYTTVAMGIGIGLNFGKKR